MGFVKSQINETWGSEGTGRTRLWNSCWGRRLRVSLGTGQDPDPWAPAFRATRGWPGRMQAARPWAARAAGVALQGQEEEQVHRGGLRASDPLLPSGALERWLGRAWGFLPCPASATAPGRTGDASWSPGRPWEGTLPCRAPHPPSAEHRLVWLQAGSSAGPCSPVVLRAALPPPSFPPQAARHCPQACAGSSAVSQAAPPLLPTWAPGRCIDKWLLQTPLGKSWYQQSHFRLLLQRRVSQAR